VDAGFPGAQPAESDLTGCGGSGLGILAEKKLPFIANESFGTAPRGLFYVQIVLDY
jgi:hypothetical protein